MTHQQILEKLAAKSLVESIDLDLGIIIRKQWNNGLDLSDVKEKLLLRWNCVLEASKEEFSNDLYKSKVVLAICVLLHKYGLSDNSLTNKAIIAIDYLNKEVALSDAFFHQTDAIKEFIRSKPLPLKKRPPLKDMITFYRAQDIISIQLDGKYYLAYIHETDGNRIPIIEFYDIVMEKRPTEISFLETIKAKGSSYNDGTKRITRYSISGMKDLPDLANQIHLVKAGVELPPVNNHLEDSIGLYTMSDITELPSVIENLFRK